MSAKLTYEELEQRIKELEGQRSGHLELDLPALFQGFEDSFPVGITDHKGVVLYVNNALVEMWGSSSPEEIIGRQLAEFWEGPGIYKTMEDLTAKGWSIGEDVGKRKDGSLFPVDYKAIMCTDFDGKPLYMLGQFVDITDKKNAEQVLRESEERYRSFIENSPVAMFTINTKGEFTYANKKLLKMTGYNVGEWIDKPFDSLIYPEDLSFGMEKIQKRRSGRGCTEPYEIRVSHASGDTLWVKITPESIYKTDESGEKRLVGVQCFVQDITSGKLAEQALKESEEKFRLISEQSLMAIAIIQDNRIKYANQAFSDIGGYTPEEIMNWTLVDVTKLIHPDDYDFVLKQGLKKSAGIREGAVTHYSCRVVTKSGGVRWVDQYSKTITYRGKPANLTTYIDIHEQKLAEEELLKAKKMESVGILAGGVAHDFNNLLSIILGSLSIAKEDMKQGIDISGFLNKMEKASLQARDLTHQLITFSTGGEPVKKETSVGRFLKESVLLALSNTNIRCYFLISEDLWPVKCDEAQMRQVFRNAVDNAVEAMKDDGVIEVQTENFTQPGESRSPELPLQEGKYIKISMHDQGAGIAKEDLPQIFDPYFSTKERGTQKGMGLGLAAAYSIIKRHDGHIAVESQVNIGTTIHIYLPAISPKREEPGAERVQAASQYSIVNSQYSIKRVLVMDDEEMIRDLIKQMLPRIGYEVEVAWDGVEAIDLYKEAMASGKPFDMVILDLTNKGGMGGMETIKRLLQIDPDVKAIISSGYSYDPVMGNFKQYGFCGVLPKPFSMKQLEEVLDKP